MIGFPAAPLPNTADALPTSLARPRGQLDLLKPTDRTRRQHPAVIADHDRRLLNAIGLRTHVDGSPTMPAVAWSRRAGWTCRSERADDDRHAGVFLEDEGTLADPFARGSGASGGRGDPAGW